MKAHLTEGAPLDGKGSWSGVVYIPAVNLPNDGTIGQNAPVTVHAPSQFPSNCTHVAVTASGVIPPFERRQARRAPADPSDLPDVRIRSSGPPSLSHPRRTVPAMNTGLGSAEETHDASRDGGNT